MTENIYDLANNLERAIRALPEYQAILDSKQQIAKDIETKQLWEEFTSLQAEVQNMLQAGQMPSQQDQERMTAVLARIEANPSLKTYLDQQQRLYVYVADLERIIFAPLKELGQ